MEKFIGSYIEIISDGITYRGFIKAIHQKDRKIVMEKVVNYDTGSKLRKDQHFYGSQIDNLKIVDQVPPDIKKEDEFEQKNAVKDPIDFLKMDASDNGPSLFQLGHLQPNLYLSGIPSREQQVNGLNEPPDAMMIDTIDEQYFNAVTDIGTQKVISLVIDGQKINRFGDITFVTIGTRSMVYLFDLHLIGGNEFFINGIQNILENPDILKVIHDVRLLSDCVKAKYNVLPVNIFDTQVADAFIYKNLNGDFPEEVSSLTDCFVHHLNLSPKECTFEKEKRKLIQRSQNFWSHRPVSMQFQKLCAKVAVYLRELRTVMLEKLIAEYLHGVDIYLKTIAEKSDNAAKYTNLRKLPKQFKTFTSGQNTWRRNRERCKGNLKYDDVDSDYDDNDNSKQQRSAWDTGTDFSEQYQKRHGEIIECLDDESSLIDRSKPLLRTKNSPNVNQKSRADNSHHNRFDHPFQKDKTDNHSPVPFTHSQLSNSKIDMRLFPTKTRVSPSPPHLDGFQFSTFNTQQSEGDFGMDFVNDNLQMLAVGNELDYASKSSKSQHTAASASKQHVPRISDAGKRMIMDSLSPNNHTKPISRNGKLNMMSSFISTAYQDEFPSLDELHQSSTTTLKTSAPAGVKSAEEKKSPRGRGQILKTLTQQYRTDMASPSVGNIAMETGKTLGDGNNVYEFPCDEELLEMPHVTPQISGATVVGERVNILQKFAKD